MNIIPNTAQERMQAQAAIEQAQAQARIAAAQAKVQAQLDANQARLESQVAARQAGTQARLDAARQSAVTAAQSAVLPPPLAEPMQGPLEGRVGTMQLTALTPQLGRYFGTDRGVLVVRAPTHGVLQLQDGDVILSIGGRTPASPSQAIRILTSYDPGEKIRLVIMREHHRRDISVTLPPLPAGP
jgi:multidrug efflux pump subunit AcrA (membrane-fusion protein)